MNVQTVAPAATSSTSSPSSDGSNPWAGSTIQNALATLQASTTSYADKFSAWNTIENQITDHSVAGGPARLSVVNDPSFTAFSDQVSQAYDNYYSNAMTQGAAPGQNTQQLANNFNGLSSNDQLTISSLLGPQLGSPSNFANYLQTRANVEKVIGDAEASAGFNDTSQLTDPKYSTLIGLLQSGSNSTKVTASWATQAQAALTALNSQTGKTSNSSTVNVTLSPAAIASMQNTSPAEANMKQGLKTLTSKEAGVSSADVAVAVLKNNAAAQTSVRSNKIFSSSETQGSAQSPQNQYEGSLLDTKA